MAALKFYKVSSLPSTLEPNALYLVEEGINYTAYQTDDNAIASPTFDPVVIIRAIVDDSSDILNTYQRYITTASIIPGMTQTVMTFLPAEDAYLRSVVVSGNGDAHVSVFADGLEIDRSILNRNQPRLDMYLGYGLEAGKEFEVTIKCEGMGTSDYFISLLHN